MPSDFVPRKHLERAEQSNAALRAQQEPMKAELRQLQAEHAEILAHLAHCRVPEAIPDPKRPGGTRVLSVGERVKFMALQYIGAINAGAAVAKVTREQASTTGKLVGLDGKAILPGDVTFAEPAPERLAELEALVARLGDLTGEVSIPHSALLHATDTEKFIAAELKVAKERFADELPWAIQRTDCLNEIHFRLSLTVLRPEPDRKVTP